MLRILHSLPRTHKLLLLPVATMVTVLGTQQILGALDAPAADSAPQASTLDTDERNPANGDTPVVAQRSPLSEGIELASHALDATRRHIPIAELKAKEIVDIDFIASAHAGPHADADQPLMMRQAVADGTDTIDDGIDFLARRETTTVPRLDDEALQLALQLPWGDATDSASAGGTSYDDSYDDFSVPLMLVDGDSILLDDEIAAKKTFVPKWETYTVNRGDTFALLAEHTLGLGYSEAMALLEALPDQNVLTRWRVGQHFDYRVDEDGRLQALRVMKNARSGYLIERDGDQDFEVAEIEKTGEAAQRLFAGTVSGSFARSAEATGLSSPEVAELTNLLAKKLDFRRDTRRGDRFQVLVESDVIEGESLDSRILAVQYEGSRMDLTLVRNATDSRFYTPEGNSLDPAFNRRPFDGSYRLSSSFNLRRKHPVTGRISPHHGTDFAMPSGTPVQAPANGKVIKSTHHPLAGNYLVVLHDNGYKTRYLHLSQRLAKVGQRVSMGDRIALSGNTGRSTGPHLHYEIIVNDNRVDPMRVDLPEGQRLSGDALVAFQREAKPLLARLESGQTGTIVASRSTSDRSNLGTDPGDS